MHVALKTKQVKVSRILCAHIYSAQLRRPASARLRAVKFRCVDEIAVCHCTGLWSLLVDSCEDFSLMNDRNMAVAMEPLPVSPSQNAWASPGFGRYNPIRRVESPNVPSQQGLTLESLADLLSTSPNGGFHYLSGGVYNNSWTSLTASFPQSNGERPYVSQKSKSFPRVKLDEPRKSCVQPEGTFRRTKSVRFADSQGLPLIEAVHRLTSADSSYTENEIVPYTDEQVFGPQSVTSKNPGIVCEPPHNLDASGVNKIGLSRKGSLRHIKPVTSPSSPHHVHTIEFTQPGSEPGFFERVSREYVVLESIREGARSMHGVIRVSNLAYQKEVTVRWTHDNWKSNHDTHAVFCANDGATDRFTFQLPVNGDDVLFAIRFRAQGQEYWDSNRGRNYLISSRQ